ncbi:MULTISPECIES: TonB-dependent receptor [unclassified Leeuwenhoekiella]|uniref:TonB-dependent receptor n=1 Tax=unclassified Leeuwenhoekiella TaxID=2615029 RepID=UPI000C6A67D7|nr:MULTISPECIES: TonB-dependent receptor [unclassified Leeuwenhoekiella]MAW96789.1 TonB-dependent receptor [Leeuwenhoekiella sp.]MBA82384.1 TonB-dependent receptor [Leeuwenhoekiella sp.]|tara:strand:+ start:7752 stop:9974 length:2223 start_codon:yes stop_codon:yes gene_type:complete
MKTLLFACAASLTTFGALAQQKPVIDTTEVNKLDEVLVQSIRVDADSPITYSNLSKQEIEERNLGQDLPILLNYLPSVVTTSDAGAGVGYTGFRVRGTGNQGINVTINGIPYNDAESLGSFFVNLQDFSSSIQSVQLQRGVGTSTNGAGAFGASLNILTDASDDKAYAEVNASGGSFNTRRANVKFGTGLINEHFSFSGRLSAIKSDGYVDRASSDLKSYFLQGSYRDENTLLKAIVFGGHEITYQSWNGIDAETLATDRTFNPIGFEYDDEGNFEGFYNNQVDNYKQDHVQLLWNQKYGGGWSTNLALNYTMGRGYFEEYVDSWYYANVNFSDDATFEYIGWEPYEVDGELQTDTDLIRRRWLDNRYYVANLTTNYSDENIDFDAGVFGSIYSGDHYGEITWARYFSQTEEAGYRYYFGTADKDEFTTFAKATWRIDETWSIFGDIQGRFIDYSTDGLGDDVTEFVVDENYAFFNPKAGVTITLDESNKIYASYARANREPNRTDFENGNPIPESLNDFELGYRFTQDRARVYANVYYMDYRNQLVLTGAIDDVGAPIRQNSGSSYRLGLEIEAGVELIPGLLATTPNIALSTNKNRDFFFERDGELRNLGNTNISYSPNVVAANRFDVFPMEGLRLSLLSKYVGEQYLGNIDAESSKLDAYFVNDFNAQYELGELGFAKSVTLTLLVNNFLCEEYVSNGYFFTYDDDFTDPGTITTIEGTGYYPQAKINFLIGASVRF